MIFHSLLEKNPWWKAGRGIMLPDFIVLSCGDKTTWNSRKGQGEIIGFCGQSSILSFFVLKVVRSVLIRITGGWFCTMPSDNVMWCLYKNPKKFMRTLTFFPLFIERDIKQDTAKNNGAIHVTHILGMCKWSCKINSSFNTQSFNFYFILKTHSFGKTMNGSARKHKIGLTYLLNPFFVHS